MGRVFAFQTSSLTLQEFLDYGSIYTHNHDAGFELHNMHFCAIRHLRAYFDIVRKRDALLKLTRLRVLFVGPVNPSVLG
jgi:hypothetical protein